MKRIVAAAFGLALLTTTAHAQNIEPTEDNIVYGMVSGAAMLMDLYVPEEANGASVIVVPGSGWYRPEIYSAPQLKDLSGYDYIRNIVGELQMNGYTVFVINHRSSPGNRFPAAVNDTRRAVRYVRTMAESLGLDPMRIATLGHSSGANLATMAALMDDAPGEGVDAIDQTSAAVQATIGIATPFMLAGDPAEADSYAAQTITMYTGVPFFGPDNHYQAAPPIHVQASPATYVDPNDPPLYMIDSADDPVVPVSQGDYMLTVLNEAGARYEHVRTEGGEHNPDFDVAAMIDWLDGVLGE